VSFFTNDKFPVWGREPDSQTCRPSWHTTPERGEGVEKERGRRNEEEEGERINR
jgi:hypothetical protein